MPKMLSDKPRKISFTFSAEEDFVAEFELLSRNKGSDRSKTIREFIINYIKKHSKNKEILNKIGEK